MYQHFNHFLSMYFQITLTPMLFSKVSSVEMEAMGFPSEVLAGRASRAGFHSSLADASDFISDIVLKSTFNDRCLSRSLTKPTK